MAVNAGANQYTGPAHSTKVCFMVVGNITTTVSKGRQAGSISSLCIWDVYERIQQRTTKRSTWVAYYTFITRYMNIFRSGSVSDSGYSLSWLVWLKLQEAAELRDVFKTPNGGKITSPSRSGPGEWMPSAVPILSFWYCEPFGKKYLGKIVKCSTRYLCLTSNRLQYRVHSWLCRNDLA